MARYHIETQGCRANLADSLALGVRLERAGHRRAPRADLADLIVINTCTVTARADRDARQLVARLRRGNAAARIVLTGCLAEAGAARAAAIPGVDRVVGNRDKPRLLPMLGLAGAEAAGPDLAEGTLWDTPTSYPELRATGHTRAFLKVQEGCDAQCSFCIIPRTRGRARSLPLERVLEAVRALGRGGLREVVLTGIHLGHWGRDLGSSLATLLRALDRLDAPERIRLTSIEPNEVTPEIVAIVAGSARLAPHFHLPLQSGSDRILGAMRRPYTAARYAASVESIARELPRAGIGADLLAGFPGERAAEQAATLRLVESLPLTYLHVFSYSARAGTDAAGLPGQLAPGVIAERSGELRRAGKRLQQRYAERLAGSTETVLTLAGEPPGTPALTGGFLAVRLAGTLAPNLLLSVKLERPADGIVPAACLAA